MGLDLHVIAKNGKTYKGFNDNPYVKLVGYDKWYNAIIDMMNNRQELDTVNINSKIIFNEKVFDQIFD